jgi:hypothetical protein
MLLHERAPDALNPELDIPDLATEFPDSHAWLRNHLLSAGLASGLDAERRALFLSIIRRATHALSHFASARERTLLYAGWDCSGAIPASDYFGAIEDWENCLLQFQILIDVMNKSMRGPEPSRMYERGDDSCTERMCEMANRVKHSTRGQITAKDLTPLWLEKEGLGALDGFRVSYVELADELRGACKLAEDLVDPVALSKRVNLEQADAVGSEGGTERETRGVTG